MLTAQDLNELVVELASRPGHEKVRVLLHRLLVDGLGADSRDIYFERPVPEVCGRIDALLGRTVFELKSDLRRERKDAEKGLTRYLSEREGQTGEKYVGITTDGADFIAFFLKNGSVVEVGAHRTHLEKPPARAPISGRDSLTAWLQGVVAIGDSLPPTPHAIKREFGRDSLAAKRALDDLGELWFRIGQTPEVRLKRELWDRLLGLAYGTEVADDALFLQHTYLVIIAKAVAWAAMIDAPPQNGNALLHGTAFSDLGITGQSEPDFFAWVLADDVGAELVMRTARQVNRFRLHNIRVDILKALYESLIDPETRHDLGEYYTPDWLAARMVADAVDNPLERRVMDPACGSGTFLFHAVRAVLNAADASGLSPAKAAQRAVGKVAGIDIHPVAVIFARVTYLLALLPALREEHPGEVALPVYLGDALQWNVAQSRQQEKQFDMFADDDTLEIFVPAITLTEPKPMRLDAAKLLFPAAIAADAQLFDRVLGTMIDFGERSSSPDDFAAWVEREVSAPTGSRRVLRETYEVMRRLQGEGRNHIWGYVARNLARPVWLAADAQKADVVIGNPPWVSFRYMGADFKKRFRDECRAAKLWVGGKVATQQDLASYFYMRTALLYMRRTGRIALVMPYAALSRQAYAAFRKGNVAQFGHVAFRLHFTEAWAFGSDVKPLFPVPSGVLFAQVHDGPSIAQLPAQVVAFAGTLPRRDADVSEAAANLTEAATSWPMEASDQGESPYRSAFRNGAALWPRRLVLVEAAPVAGMLPPNPMLPLVRGRTGSLDKKPWRTVEPPLGTVEKKFLRSVLLGESVAPFRVLAPQRAIIPWDTEWHGLLDAQKASRRGYPKLAQWLTETEALWNRHKRSGLSLLEQCDYYGKLSCQFPVAPIRVVYTKAGTNLAAAVVRDEAAIIDHTLYWTAAESPEEARYLCGILNSKILRTRVERYQSQGQWGARHFDKYVFNLPIPRFDGNNPLHRELARSARTAEEVAETVSGEEGEYFTRTRRRVRSVLTEHGIAAELELLTERLLERSPDL